MKPTCYSCGRILGKTVRLVDTHEDQIVQVGPECFKHIHNAPDGWQAKDSEVRLFPMTAERIEYFKSKGMWYWV